MMKCPKCEEGTIGTIKLKSSGKIASLCSFCDSLWFANEMISPTTGHTLRAYVADQIEDYEECDEQDQDHRPIHIVRNL